MTRKADIMYALEMLELAKNNASQNLPNTAVARINIAIEWIQKALDIAPTDEAISEVMAKDDSP